VKGSLVPVVVSERNGVGRIQDCRIETDQECCTTCDGEIAWCRTPDGALIPIDANLRGIRRNHWLDCTPVRM